MAPGRNNSFRKSLGIHLYDTAKANSVHFPLTLICPEAYGRYQTTPSATSDYGAVVNFSYGYNTTKFFKTSVPNQVYISMKFNKIHAPVRKILWADAMDWQVNDSKSNHYMNPNYPEWTELRPNNSTGGQNNYVAYRHSQKWDRINIVFWDGHAETLDRGEIATADGFNDESTNHRNYNLHWNPEAP